MGGVVGVGFGGRWLFVLHGDCVMVLLASEDYGALGDRRNFEGAVECVFARGSIAHEADRDGVLALEFHGVSGHRCVRQLRGAAGARQVADAKLALVHGNGGTIAIHCTLILGL